MLSRELRTELESLAKLYRPRKDVILIKVVSGIKSEGGVLMPDISSEGKASFIVAAGEEVKDLQIGDRVMVAATEGTLAAVPGQRGLYVTRQTNCMLVLT